MEKHPKVPDDGRAKRIFVVLQDTSVKAMLEYNEWLATLEFPEGTDAAIAAAGM